MEADITQLAPSRIIEEVLPRLAQDHPAASRAVGAVLAIELTGERGGAWTIDLTDAPVAVVGIREDACCVIRMEADHFSRLLKTGKITPWLKAFTNRQIRVEGDMPTALKVGRILTGGRQVG